MTDPRWPTHAAARAAGWFSRRHETDVAHREASKKYRATHGAAARRARVADRELAANLRAEELGALSGGKS